MVDGGVEGRRWEMSLMWWFGGTEEMVSRFVVCGREWYVGGGAVLMGVLEAKRCLSGLGWWRWLRSGDGKPCDVWRW